MARFRSQWILCLLLALAVPAALLAQGSVTGRVTDLGGDPLPGVSIIIVGGTPFTVTGVDGSYTLDGVAAGAHTVQAVLEGFKTARQQVTVSDGATATADFTLELDLLSQESIVVTGTRSPIAKRESSVSITTLTVDEIEAREPRSTADLLKVVPGFYVESSGGEVGGNLFARGLPADGSFRYVALMEDGMPVFDSTELFFVNADIFVRFDENVAEMEAVRGGNAALFGSNAPGGVINLITKTGTSTPQTDLKFTLGSGGLWRVGFNNRGPLTDEWSYSIGGFYRFDDGVRDPGYPASEGGQLKFNLGRAFEDGYVRAYAKYLNDSNVFYLPLPLAAGKDLNFVPGFPLDGTLHTPEANHLRAPRPNGEGFADLPLEDGQLQEGYSVMLEISKQIGGDWLLENKARVMDVDHSWNAVVPFDLVRPADFAAGFTPPGGSAEFSFTNHDIPFSTPNNLLLTAGLWHVEKPMQNFSNQFQLTKQFSAGGTSHTLTVGTYTSNYDVGNLWFFNDILTDVRDQPRLVDLTVFDGAGTPLRVTDNGFRSYGSFFVHAKGDVDIFAVFAGDQIQLNEKVRIDVGARFEQDDFRQFVEDIGGFDLGDPTTLADNNVTGGLGTTTVRKRGFEETAFSVGVNYLLNDNVALWGRGSTGFKMPILDSFLFGDVPVAEALTQFEVGTRIGRSNYGLNLTAYLLTLEDFPTSDARIDPDTGETIFEQAFVGEAETVGIEAELVAHPTDRLRINAIATLQQPEYTKFGEGSENQNGNTVRRIAEEIFDLTIGYYWNRASVSGNYQFIGDRFANNSNTIELPSYDVVTFRGTYDLGDRATLSAAILNAFNSKGLTEGNPRLDETSAAQGAVYLARPVLPRRATVSIAFAF